MKKIVFCNVSMQKNLKSCKYVVDGYSNLNYNEKVAFPISAILAKTMKQDDELKIVLLKVNDCQHNCDENEIRLKNEIYEVNKNIGAKINFVTLNYPYESTKSIHERMIKDVIKELEDNVHILSDITYGAKPFAIAMFGILNFAEKFFDLTIDYIIYGKVEHIVDASGVTHPENAVIYDISSLYYLNSITNTIECKDKESALKMLDMLLPE